MIKQSEFHGVLCAISHSVAGVKEARETLRSVLFEFLEDSVNIVSTDGHRISIATLAIKHPPCRFLVSREDIKDLLGMFKYKSDKRIQFIIQSDLLVITNGRSTLQIDRMEGEFPNYLSIVPSTPPTHGVVRFNATYIAEMIRACKYIINTDNAIDITPLAIVDESHGAPTTFKVLLDPTLEILQSFETYIMPAKRTE